MKLIGSLTSPYTRKVRIVAAEKRIDLDLQLDNVMAADAKTPAFNPLGKVPVLVLEDGRTIFDSRVIVEFLDHASPISRLIPADHRERVDVRRWEALADGILDAGILVRFENLRPQHERSQSWIDRQMGKVTRGLAEMDKELGTNPWCATSSYSLADIAVGCCTGWLNFRFPQLGWQKQHANLARHVAKLAERPTFADTTPRE
ncbi:MAG: glutathione S-transferase N-terminal domain-containing protein [Burkholderiales bacterium]|jgi:glutathione S-transferase|nr:glutathione S-transferase N-terminal domain-containing protein [Burkholderiales bacterium]